MSMCIGYCLAASLIVALTVAPAASSTLLKNSKPKELKWFDKVQEKYVKSLEWCFQHRWAPLGAAVVLLVFCGWRVMSMGVEMLPTITSNEAIVTLSTEKDMTKEESYAVAENVIDALLAVDNVEEVGVTTDSRVAGMDVGQLGLPQTITDLLKAANSYGTYQINVMLDESLSSRQIEQAREALEEAVNGVENCTATVEISGMQELTSQLDMGLTVQVSGNDIDTMTALSEKVVDMVNEMDGFTNATNGLGSGDATINLQIDRDKVRSYGLTVAQVYQQIAAKLTTTTTAQTPVAIDGSTMNVQISNNLDPHDQGKHDGYDLYDLRHGRRRHHQDRHLHAGRYGHLGHRLHPGLHHQQEPDPLYQCDGGRSGGHQYHHRDPRAGKEAERVCRIR